MSFPSWLNNFLVNILFYGMCIGIVGGFIRWRRWEKINRPETHEPVFTGEGIVILKSMAITFALILCIGLSFAASPILGLIILTISLLVLGV